MTKSQLKKQRAAEKKAAKKAAAAARNAQKAEAQKASQESADVSKGKYGEDKIASLSKGDFARGSERSAAQAKYTPVAALEGAKAGSVVTVRCRLHKSRGTGNMVFLVLRDKMHTVQAVVAKSETVSKLMVTFAGQITKESVVDVIGEVKAAPEPIKSTTQSDVELHVQELWVRVPARHDIPFSVEDAGRSEAEFAAQEAELDALDQKIAAETDEKAVAALQAEKESIPKFPRVAQATRLDNRTLDLRVPAHMATFRIQSWVQRLFREFCYSRNFTEIHTPKIIGGASEGGAEVFKLDYFGREAFLAQSPQLYKQMALVSDFGPGVFEVGPVFRAENSNTHRHLCEFMGMDVEMVIKDHYHEAVDTIDALFNHIFVGIEKNCQVELETIRKQYPFEPLKFKYPSPRLDFNEGIALLREHGVEIEDNEDIDTVNEKLLGKLIREKYDTDFYILDKWPLALRPFYTMPDADNPELSNSYDMFIRGQEILSGAQRCHIPEMLRERAKVKGVPEAGVAAYIDSFTNAAEPHAGGGIGLERVVFLMLGLGDIRYSSMFPRDPKRTTP